MAWSEWKNVGEIGLSVSSLQVGSVNDGQYEQFYTNNGCKTITYSLESGSSYTITVYGSNDNSSWNLLNSASSSATVDVENYKYIKLVTLQSPVGYGKIATFNITVS